MGKHMITSEDGRTLPSLTALRDIVGALERKFPGHNGPFEYGVRLCEEVGELTEAVQLALLRHGRLDDVLTTGLVKELQDVLRATVGIASLYKVALPDSLDDIQPSPTTGVAVDYLLRLSAGAGRLAAAINLAEGAGVKIEKHGNSATKQLSAATYEVIGVILRIVELYNLHAELERSIEDFYRRYAAEGFTQPAP